VNFFVKKQLGAYIAFQTNQQAASFLVGLD
jgi:hypothetical protein